MAMTGGTAKLVKSEHPDYGNKSWTIDLYVYYKTSQDIANNRSTITVGMYVYAKYDIGPWNSSGTSYVGTTGNTFSGAIPNFSGTRWLAENKTFTVNHNDDGSGTATIAWKWAVNSPWGRYVNPSGSFTITLPNIPRKATITSAPNFSDDGNPTIYYSNPAGNYATELAVCISLTGSVADVAYRYDISKTGSSYTFKNITDAERNVLRNNTTGNGGKRNVLFMLRTKIGGNTYYHNVTREFTVKETTATKPSVTITTSPVNTNLASKFSSLYIRGKSKVRVEFTASGKYNATISSYTAGGVGISATGNPAVSGILNYDGLLDVKGTVKDSRGFTNYDTEQINVIPYDTPYISPYDGFNEIVCARCDSQGNISHSGIYLKVKCKRNYSKVISDSVQKNFCALQYKIGNGEWTEILAKSDTTTDLVDVKLTDGSLLITNTYTVQLRVVDDIMASDPLTFQIPTDDVALHLGIGGKNVSIGAYCDYSRPNTFQSEWLGIFNNGIEGYMVNPLASDLLQFALDCSPGLTPFFTGETTANLPSNGNFKYSTGIVHKRTQEQINVYITNYLTGAIAINVYFDGTWKGWKYLTPQ